MKLFSLGFYLLPVLLVLTPILFITSIFGLTDWSWFLASFGAFLGIATCFLVLTWDLK